MDTTAGQDHAVAAARAFVASQRVRHRVLVVVLLCAALLDAGLVAAAVTAVAGVTRAGLVALVVLAVAAMLSFLAQSARVSGAVAAAEESEGRERLEEIVGRMAPLLWMEVPRVRVLDDSALNAFVVGYGRDATLVLTSGLVAECEREDDSALLEAVVAHELAVLASRGATLTRLSRGLFGWALLVIELADGLARELRTLGKELMEIPPDKPGQRPGQKYDEYVAERAVGFALTKGLGALLALASVCVMLLCAVPWLVAHLTRWWMISPRVMFADEIAAQLTGDKAALIEMLTILEEGPTTVSHGGRAVQELCFAGLSEGSEGEDLDGRDEPRPWMDSWEPPYPSLGDRRENLENLDDRKVLVQARLAGPVVAGLLALALLGGLGVLAVRLPFTEAPGRPPVAGAQLKEAPVPVDPPTYEDPPSGREPEGPTTPPPGQDTTESSTPTSTAPTSTPPNDIPPGDVPPGELPPDDDAPPDPPDGPDAPDTADPPELNTLTQGRWNDFCGRRFGVSARFGNDAYDVGCTGVEGAFGSVNEVCAFEFPDAGPNVDRLGDFHDPYSWGCIARADLLGAFPLSEASLEERTGRDVVHHADADPLAYGYTYADGSPIALGGVCTRTYAVPAVDRLLNVHDAHSTVECYRSTT